MREPAHGALVDTGFTQARQERLNQVSERLGCAALGLGRIVPAAVLAQQQLPAIPGVEHTPDALDVLCIVPRPDIVIFDPGATPGHLEVQREVGLGLRMNPDVAGRRVAGLLDDASWSATTRPRTVWLPITAFGLARRRAAAARSTFRSISVMPSSPALSLIQPARTPVPSISPVSSPSIQSRSLASSALRIQSGIQGSR